MEWRGPHSVTGFGMPGGEVPIDLAAIAVAAIAVAAGMLALSAGWRMVQRFVM